MTSIIEPYSALLGQEVISELEQITSLLKGIKILHINSTKVGGGVSEILSKLVPLTNAFGVHTKWQVIEGNSEFYQCTKMFHNLLQGKSGPFPSNHLLSVYEQTNKKNAELLKPLIEEADVIFIHDPQPLALKSHFPNHKGCWIWRCHVETSYPNRATWLYLKKFISLYNASIFSLEDFTKPLPHPIFIVPPSIDPFSEKNIELDEEEVKNIYNSFNIDHSRPTTVQISRFDWFKDPIGVIKAYKLTKKYHSDLQLVLAGGGATDDPEGTAVLNEVNDVASGDPDIHILALPPDAHRTVNGLQKGATIILQKSLKEGFGLTVTEALWKSKPTIGGNTGGIRSQLINYHTGFLVNTPEGAALRMRNLLQNPELASELGVRGKKFVRENFLITRHLRDYLTVVANLKYPHEEYFKFTNGEQVNGFAS